MTNWVLVKLGFGFWGKWDEEGVGGVLMDFLGWVHQVFWEKMWAKGKKEVKLVCLECIRE